MILKRLQLISLSMLAAISLLASPISACVCAHHVQAGEVAVPHNAHSHPGDHAALEYDPGADRPACAESTDACACVQAAPKAQVKAESLQIVKGPSATPVIVALPPRIHVSVRTSQAFEFAAVRVGDASPPSLPARGPPRS